MAKLNVPVEALEKYMQAIRDDYARWSSGGPEGLTDVRKRMIQEFNDSIKYEVGSSYIKVVEQNSVHSFIVNKAKKFPVGTILKAASWKAPATNFARGNVFEKYTIRWTGTL